MLYRGQQQVAVMFGATFFPFVCLVISAVAASACSSPASPTPTAPTSNLLITLSASSDYALVDHFVEIVATDRLGGIVPVALETTTPSTALVSGSSVRILQNGVAVVVGRFQHASAEIKIRGIADYSGSYPGEDIFGEPRFGAAYAIECIASRTFCEANILEESMGKGPEPFFLKLKQTRDKVSGSVDMRGGGGNVSGSVDENGRLTLSATALSLKSLCCQFENFQASLVANQRAINGSFDLVFKREGEVYATVRHQLRALQRTPDQ